MSYILKNRLLVLLILISSPLFGMTAKLGLGKKLRSQLAIASSSSSNTTKPKTSNTVSLSKTTKQPEVPTNKSRFYELIKEECPFPKEVITSVIFSYLTKEEIDRLVSNKIEHIYVILKQTCKLPTYLASVVMPYLSTEEIDTRLPVILLVPRYKLDFNAYYGPKVTATDKQAKMDTQGSLVCTVNLDNTVIIWDTKSGNKKHTLTDNNKIYDIHFSKNGSLLATVSKNKVVIWDTATGTAIRTFSHEDKIISLNFNDNGTQLIVADKSVIVIWDIKTSKALHRIEQGSSSSKNLIISIDKENSHAITLESYSALIWDLNNTQEPLYILDHGNRITSLRCNNNNTAIITAGEGGTVKLWDIKTGKLIRKFQHDTVADSLINFAEFSKDDKYIITGNRFTAKIWDIESSEIIHTLPYEGIVSFAQFNNNNSCIITSGISGPIVWDAQTGKALGKLNIDGLLDAKVVLNNNNSVALASGGYRCEWLLQVPSLNFNQLLLLSRIQVYANSIRKAFSIEKLAADYELHIEETKEIWLTFSKDLRTKISKLYELTW